MNKENLEKENDNNNSKVLLHNKRKRSLQIPFELKQKLTLRLMDECFTDDLILTGRKKENKKNKKEEDNATKKAGDDEIADILNEISEIGSELELFAMENRKRRMVKLLEKMAEYIDENAIDIDELTNEFFFGKSAL